jgi:hypothetical protein
VSGIANISLIILLLGALGVQDAILLMMRESNDLIIPSRFFCIYGHLDVYHIWPIAFISIGSSYIL